MEFFAEWLQCLLFMGVESVSMCIPSINHPKRAIDQSFVVLSPGGLGIPGAQGAPGVAGDWFCVNLIIM